jgi:hypothetical protein
MTPREQSIWQIMNRPVDIGRAMSYTKLFPIEKNPMHNDWIKMMMFSTEDILLWANRESYKTTCAIIAMTLQIIIFQSMAVAFTRKTDKDVAEVIKSVWKCLETPVAKGLVYNIYGRELDILTANTQEITTNIFVGSRGVAQLTGLGIGSSLTGKHFDKIHTDDICNINDRTSKAEREATKQAFGELGNVLNDKDPENKYTGVMINTGTPWHRDDVYQLMPCKPIIFDYKMTGLPSMAKIERQRKILTKSQFAANYELKHISDDGQKFTDPKYTDNPKKILYGYAHLDCAFGGDNGTAFTIMNYDYDLERYYGFGKLWTGHVRNYYGDIMKLYKDYKVDILFLEDNADKGYVADELDKMGIFTKTYHENQKKDVKIMTRLYSNWENIYWLKESDPEYINEIVDYIPGFEPDDAPDSAASLIDQLDSFGEAFIL